MNSALMPAGLAALGVCLAAHVRGDIESRRLSTVMLFLVVGHWIAGVGGFDGDGLLRFSPALAIFDLAAFALLLRAALRIDRFYPLVMAACGLVLVLSHALRFAGLIAQPQGHLALLIGSCYVLLVALLAGVFASARRVPPGDFPGANETKA